MRNRVTFSGTCHEKANKVKQTKVQQSKNTSKMKKYLIIITAMIIVPFSTFAQSYRTTTTINSWGNTIDSRTTDSYGRTVSTSSSWVDGLGNVNTTYKDSYGNRIGSSTSSVDCIGNVNTTYKDSYGNRIGSSSSSIDCIGNINTSYSNSYGAHIGSSTTSTYPYGSSTTTRDAYGRTVSTSTSSYWEW